MTCRKRAREVTDSAGIGGSGRRGGDTVLHFPPAPGAGTPEGPLQEKRHAVTTRACRTRAVATPAALTLALVAGAVHADGYDPPPGYYDGATSTIPATLSAQLHEIIDGHIERSYDDARVALQFLDASATDPTKMVLIYNGQAVEKQWDAGVTWNREHTWPRSRGVDTSGPDNSDLHMLRPCNSSVNGSRGNKPFGSTSGSYWDPAALGAPDRGEIARAQFYADVRYDGGEAATTDLTLVNGFPSGSQMGDLDEMLQWHFAYPPDERERRRNHLIWSDDPDEWFDPEVSPIAFTLHQGNRNPFVDRPELAWVLWGAGPNNATLFVGAVPQGDGASTLGVDLGTFINGAAPPPTTVPLQKQGAHPAAYRVSTSGDATSPQAGLPLTFPFTPAPAGVSTPVLEVGVDPAATGAISGQVVIQNAQLTSAGAGQGAADADDVITLTGMALDSSNASFQSPADVDTITIDLGTVYRHGYEPSVTFSVHNLPNAFGAALDLDAIAPSGDTVLFTTDLSTFADLAPGSSVDFSATIDSSAPVATHEATYTLSCSDEDLPGEVTGQIIELTLRATIAPPGCVGDLDGDNDTDVFDFGIFVSGFGAVSGATRNEGDYDGNGTVDILDFGVFASAYGCTP